MHALLDPNSPIHWIAWALLVWGLWCLGNSLADRQAGIGDPDGDTKQLSEPAEARLEKDVRAGAS